MKIKIALFEGHTIIADILQCKLNAVPEFQIIETYMDPIQFEYTIASKGPLLDIFIINPMLPTGMAIDIIEYMRTQFPNVKIIVLSPTLNGLILTKFFILGVFAYIPKTTAYNDFKNSIIKVYHAAQPLLLKQHIYNFQRHYDILNIIETCNDKEKSFILYAPTDLTYKEIAQKLNVSINSIEATRDKLFRKFNVKTRYSFVLMCKEFYLI